MALANVMHLSQIAGHVILLILSLCIVVPLGINLEQFHGRCILFATGKWREEDGMFDLQWPSQGFCTFPLITGVSICLFSLWQIIRYLRQKEEPTFLVLFLDVLAGIWMLAMSILSAIMITLGFIVFCDGMTERFPSCESAAGQNIIAVDKNEAAVNTSDFYIEMGTAQFGAWGCFAFSVGVAVIALLKLINNHQVRNIKVSMYLERQRLVNQYQAQQDGRSTPPMAEADVIQQQSAK